MPIYGVFFHLCIKNFAEVNRNTENFSNFVLGSHSDYQFFRHLYFIELTLNYLLYIVLDTCLDLIALQYTCMIVMGVLAFFVFVSRYYVTCRNRLFEQSRGMIVAALLLFIVHFMCQMLLGWRQRGDDVGILFNLLFYLPSALLLSWSQLNILRAGHGRWSFMRYGVVGYTLMVLCIVAGVISNGSLHIGTMLYVADAIHFFTLFYYIWVPLKELGNVQRRLDSELGNPADTYLSTMRIGLFVVCAFTVISPLYILSRPLLFVFGPLGLISLSLFIVSFTALGFSMSEGVTEIVAETNKEVAAAKVFSEIVPERIAEIDMAVTKWRSEGGFRDSDLTLSSFARRIMVNRTDVASYLTSIYGKSFRTWLSGIRVEEAKALMAAHPEYSNEVVSMECGFSSRVYFQRLFKERTGLTPAEWRRQY